MSVRGPLTCAFWIQGKFVHVRDVRGGWGEEAGVANVQDLTNLVDGTQAIDSPRAHRP